MPNRNLDANMEESRREVRGRRKQQEERAEAGRGRKEKAGMREHPYTHRKVSSEGDQIQSEVE